MSPHRNSPGLSVGDVRPTPDAEELAAMVAAIELAWPRAAQDRAVQPTPRWRFSGRWWSKPLPIRRDRP